MTQAEGIIRALLQTAMDRRDDLASCNKYDRCRIEARGAELAIADMLWQLREMYEGHEPHWLAKVFSDYPDPIA